MRTIEIGNQEVGQRLDKYLKKYFREAGSGFLYKMLRKKNILLNRKKAEGKEMLKQGDQITLYLAEETIEKFRGRQPSEEAQQTYPQIPLEVLYEDRDFLLVNKPAGMLSQKASPSDHSLVEYLTGYLLAEGALTMDDLATFHPSVCNRLDRNTSGMILAGKTLQGLQKFSKLLKDRSMKKYYLCLVKGTIQAPMHKEAWLLKNHRTNQVQIHTESVQQAQRIETAYTPLWQGPDMTLLKVDLITGKSHQIRSHLASLGHPLAGDPKYGDLRWNRELLKLGLKRQFLHAWEVHFPREAELGELSGQVLRAPLPADLKRVLRTWNCSIGNDSDC